MGDIPTDRPPTRTRIPAPANDVRPGLSAPTPRIDTPPNVAQGKTDSAMGYAPVTNPQQLSPDTRWGGPGTVKIQTHPVPGAQYAATGQTPTMTGGFKGNPPSGTGLPDQVPGYEPVKTPGNSDKRAQPRTAR